MSKYTSAEAAKLLRRLNEEYEALEDRERKSCRFTVALEENPEDVRPSYDFLATQTKLQELEGKIRAVKHAINLFNTTTVVPGFDLTVDQMLVYIPQLNHQKRRLADMASHLPKERLDAGGYGHKTIIEYAYANYDIDQAQTELERVTDELARAQTALDVVNNSVQLELTL